MNIENKKHYLLTKALLMALSELQSVSDAQPDNYCLPIILAKCRNLLKETSERCEECIYSGFYVSEDCICFECLKNDNLNNFAKLNH